MISRIQGEVIAKDAGSVVVDVRGIGYEIYVSEADKEQFNQGDGVTFHTYFHVREQSQELFGFLEQDGKALFQQLIGVSGVGPKMAMAILSLGEPKNIRQAIACGNTAYISGASGVGKRLAERVCVDLKDKVGVVGGVDVSVLDTSSVGDEVVDALISLGYNKSQAMQAAAKTDSEKTVEERVKQALTQL